MQSPIYVFDHVNGTFREINAVSTGVTLRYMDPEYLCPDLLGLDYLGPADHLRGRVVRAFFWLMRFWPKPRGSRRPDPVSGVSRG